MNGLLQRSFLLAHELAQGLAELDPASVPVEAQESAAALRGELSSIVDDSRLCEVAVEAAFLSAALLDPECGVPQSQLPQSLRGVLSSLLSVLESLGLMDSYSRKDGAYGLA